MKAADYYSDACLVITRSGRNTLSELTYLGIPTISFISGCAYRQVEQKQNMDNILINNNIVKIEKNEENLKIETNKDEIISNYLSKC